MKLPWTKAIEALEAYVGRLEDRIERLEGKAKQQGEQPSKPRLMTSARTPSLIRSLEARDRAKLNQPQRIVRDVAKGPELQ